MVEVDTDTKFAAYNACVEADNFCFHLAAHAPDNLVVAGAVALAFIVTHLLWQCWKERAGSILDD